MWSLMFPLWLHHFLTLSTLWKEMEIVKKGDLLVFDTDILNNPPPPQKKKKKKKKTTEITARLMGNISTEGFKVI